MERTHLARRLTLFDATMIAVSGMIGGGIFINPSVVARTVHGPVMVLAVWAVGGLIALAGAFVFAELATVLPKVGGQYAYFRVAFHPLVAFLYGWALLFVIQSGSTAAIAVAFAEYTARLFGLRDTLVVPLAVAVTLGLVVFHSLGVKPGAVLVNLVTVGKTLALVVLIVLSFVLGPRLGVEGTTPGPREGGAALASNFFAGLVPVMFAYGGWQNLSYMAEEVRGAERALPRAIVLAVVCVIVVYLGANLAYVHVLGAAGLAATSTPAADVATRLLGPVGGAAVTALVVASTFGFLNLALMSAPRVYYAMALDGVFFASVARISPRFQVPTVAIVLQGALASALALSGSYERLLAYAVFADWTFFAAAGIALLVLRRTLPDAPRPWRLPLYPATPILFSVAGAGIVLNTFVVDTRNALTGTAILLAGVPVFFVWRAIRSRSPSLG